MHEDPEEQLRQLRAIPVRRLVPHGFVFVWAQKWNAQAVVKWLTQQDYRLVENLTWVRIWPQRIWQHIYIQDSLLGILHDVELSSEVHGREACSLGLLMNLALPPASVFLPQPESQDV